MREELRQLAASREHELRKPLTRKGARWLRVARISSDAAVDSLALHARGTFDLQCCRDRESGQSIPDEWCHSRERERVGTGTDARELHRVHVVGIRVLDMPHDRVELREIEVVRLLLQLVEIRVEHVAVAWAGELLHQRQLRRRDGPELGLLVVLLTEGLEHPLRNRWE